MCVWGGGGGVWFGFNTSSGYIFVLEYVVDNMQWFKKNLGNRNSRLSDCFI